MEKHVLDRSLAVLLLDAAEQIVTAVFGLAREDSNIKVTRDVNELTLTMRDVVNTSSDFLEILISVHTNPIANYQISILLTNGEELEPGVEYSSKGDAHIFKLHFVESLVKVLGLILARLPSIERQASSW